MGLVVAVIALVWVSAGASAPTRAKPQLRLLDRAPLALKGMHFAARERVRVTAATTEAITRSVRTARDGSFTARFGAVSAGRCGNLAAQAVGARGDRASLKVLQQEDCAPGLGP
jgi:hypothetical protein